MSLSSLPHGPSFRFIDRVISLDPGRSGTAEYHIRGDESFLPGHFPGNPILPGVILIEMIAQLGGIVAQSDETIPPLSNLRLTAVSAAKILGAAVPGETLTITATVEGRLGNLIQIYGEVSSSQNPLAKGKLTLSGNEVRSDALS
ncbi:MAG: 3-hydroxyacyl-ACP dehydratase FabZ family protein [Verrucomicrobiota bacterium]